MSYKVIDTKNKRAADIQSELNEASYYGYEVILGGVEDGIIVMGKTKGRPRTIRATLGPAEPAFKAPKPDARPGI